MTNGRIGGRLGVRGSFYSAIGAMAVLVLLFSVVGAVLLDRASQASDTIVNRIGPARTALVDMQGALIDEETGVRGYLLTRDPEFLTPYDQGEQQQAADDRQIRTLLDGHTVALGRLTGLEQAVSAWRGAYAEPFIAAAKTSSPVDQAELNASKTAFDGLRGRFATMEAGLGQENTTDQAELAHLDRVRNAAFIAMLAVFLVTVCLIVLLVQVAVLRPLTRLRADAAAVQEGNFDAPLSATGPRDIRSLGAGLEAMRARLARALAATELQRAALHRQKETLDTQAAELRRSNEELEQFAYVASHDLQEPLRKVASFCQLIEKRYGDALDDRGRQYIDYAVDGAKRMQVLINDLLTFSRVGRLNDRRDRVELQAAVNAAVESLQYVVEESGARIRVHGPLPAAAADPTLIGMLWQNLVGNALKFRAPGRTPEIEVSWEPDPDQPGFVRISVADNGIGIAPEFAEKVFVIFQRLHSREAYAGTGIGLALCKKIIEHHGGHIRIDTERESGTRFVFSLPAADPEQLVSAAVDPAADPAVNSAATDPVARPVPDEAESEAPVDAPAGRPVPGPRGPADADAAGPRETSEATEGSAP